MTDCSRFFLSWLINELIWDIHHWSVYRNGEYPIHTGSLAWKFDLSHQATPGWSSLCAMSPDEGENQGA
jgi:hypothetical protein